ncbi:bifunctional RNase H/acid phosphatase [Streptomyces sp. NPDC059582]|uniref:bifunctional RNase H/acid phosphatase n=1 Tax=Streptomyces sp. NPDC059582 TaxID=3346875 RepID=UPI0036A72321
MREFIVEADGGSRGNPGPAGYGSVVIDAATGETLAERAEYIGVATNNVAEYRGLVAGLRAARDLDPTAEVHVRMDSKLVVEQMSGRWKIKHPGMKPLAAEAARVFPPGQVTYEWIPRERNKHADRLANEAMDAGKRGEQWAASTSTAELDTRVSRATTPEPEGPPGDATAGAARVRAALTGRGSTEAAPQAEDSAGAETDDGGRAATPGTRERAAEAAGAPAVEAGPGPRAAEAGTRTDDPGASAETGGRGSRADADAATSAGAGASADAGDRAASARPGGTADGATDSDPPAANAPVANAPAPAPSTEADADSDADPLAAQGDRRGRGAKAESDVRAARGVAAPGWAPADMGAPATFVLLRHGETPLTPQKRFSGSGGSDPSLSAVGREQAERVAAALARRGTIEAIVASPLARTRETAGAVAARLGLEVTVDDGLRETDFGVWEGLTFGEVRERYPDDLNAWLADPEAEPTGGGESFAATGTRIAATRDRLVAAYAGRTVLLVSHVTPIKTFLRLALGAPPEALFRMELSAASLSAVAYYADGNASVRLFNDTSHLR